MRKGKLSKPPKNSGKLRVQPRDKGNGPPPKLSNPFKSREAPNAGKLRERAVGSSKR